MERRTYLTLGALFSASLSGCMMFEDTEQEGVIPTQVEFTNATGEPKTFTLHVEFDGETIHQTDHEVGVGDGEYGEEIKTVEIDAPDEPGITYVESEVDGQTRTVDFDSDFSIEHYDGERVTIVFKYVRRGDQEEPTFTHSVRISDRS